MNTKTTPKNNELKILNMFGQIHEADRVFIHKALDMARTTAFDALNRLKLQNLVGEYSLKHNPDPEKTTKGRTHIMFYAA